MALDKKKSNFDISSIFPSKAECLYTSCYCEENIWWLCKHVKKRAPNHLSRLSVLFISNPNKSVPIWEQKSQTNSEYPVVWDYHVVLMLYCSNTDNDDDTNVYYIYDFDTKLPFPSLMLTYIKNALRTDFDFKEDYKHFIKVISASNYLKEFASDRSHMKLENGKWSSPPPSYSCISTNECKMNLFEFMNMKPESQFGTVYSLPEFKKIYSV